MLTFMPNVPTHGFLEDGVLQRGHSLSFPYLPKPSHVLSKTSCLVCEG
jgi:hypothetical protein